MPQPLKFKTDVDVQPFEAGMGKIVKLGANAAAQLDKIMGSRISSIAAKLSSPQQAAITAATSGFAAASAAMDKIRVNVGRFFDAGKAIQQLHRATGGGVAGLVVLEDKFKKAGLEGNAVAAAIFRLQKSIAGIEDDENKGGTGALQKLGLNLGALKKLAPDQQLMAVGRALSGIADPAERTADAMQIFGRAGGELGAVFNGSDFNRISPQLQAKADMLARNSEAFERASRSIQRVEGVVQASANTFYGGVAEGVVKGLQPLLDDVKSVDLSDMGKSFGKALGDGAVAIHHMLDELKASGLVELGQKIAAGATKSVEVASTVVGDAVKVARPSGQTSAVLGGMSFLGGLAMDQVQRQLGAVHTMINLPDTVRAELARRSDARYADLHNNPADPGVASTNRRAETRAVNNRPLTLPAVRAQTLPDPNRRLAPSAPGGKYTETDLYEQESRRRQAAAAMAPQIAAHAATADRVTVAGGDLTYLTRMHLANGGMNTRGMTPDAIGKLAASHVYMGGGSVDANGNANDPYTARVDAMRQRIQAIAHTVGRGTALDFDPSGRPGWTGARDAFSGLRAASNDPAEVARAARERANYFGTSGSGYGGHTGLTSGGLGGGAYGRTGNIWSQMSGRVGGSGDAMADTAKNTATLVGKVQELINVWNGAMSGGSRSGGGGATITG